MHDQSSDLENKKNLLLSSDDFKHMGLNQIAYVKSFIDENDEMVFSVHAADGTQISLADSYAMAVAAVRYHDMHPVTVQ
ncbi:MAG: DUF1150 family protein [Alphaproteobacteria bacterium]|nr:DUF1150 family protein [Alphaproteobacteria bacterium]